MECKLTLTIKKEFATKIYYGQKQIEGRPASKTMEKIAVGDRICFHWHSQERLLCEVVKLWAKPTTQMSWRCWRLMGLTRSCPAWT